MHCRPMREQTTPRHRRGDCQTGRPRRRMPRSPSVSSARGTRGFWNFLPPPHLPLPPLAPLLQLSSLRLVLRPPLLLRLLLLLQLQHEERDGLGVRREIRADVSSEHRHGEQRHRGSHAADRDCGPATSAGGAGRFPPELSLLSRRLTCVPRPRHDCDERLGTAQPRRSSARVAATSGAVAPAAVWLQCRQHA